MNYWDNNSISTQKLLKKLLEKNIIRTIRYIPGGVDFFYADRIVSLTLGEAKWFALAHLYHLENDDL